MGSKSNIKSKQMKNKGKKKRSKIKVFFVKLLFFIILLTIIGGIGFGIYYLCTSSKFDIEKVDVIGQGKYTQEEILEVSKIPIGNNIFLTRKGIIEDKIEKKFPYIYSVKIKMSSKNSLKIIIKERERKYVAVNNETNEYIRLDKYGIILEKVLSNQVENGEMLLFGISFDDDIKLGTSITKSEVGKINNYEGIKKEYDNHKIENKITSIKFEKGNVILVLDYKLSIIISPVDNLEYRIKFLNEILKEVSGRTGEVDITKENPSFVEK